MSYTKPPANILWQVVAVALAMGVAVRGSAQTHKYTEKVLYSFSGADGANPYAGLVLDAAGNLYGTTYAGGVYGLGTVFKVDPAGHETVLHSFNGGDGANPYAGLVLDAAGNLYCTTYGGYGVVF